MRSSVKTLEGRILSWNAGATRIFGYRADEVIGKPITIIIPAELQDEEPRILDQVRRGERIDHFDTIRVTKDGRRVPISLTVSPVRDSRGLIIGASKVARDISERKRAEQALLESERRLAAEADALAKLNEWSTRLWRSRCLDEGLDEILAAVIELLGAEKGDIQLLDATGSGLSIVAQRGFEQEFLEFFREVSATDDSACGRALRSRDRIVIEDVETDGPFAPFRPIARAAGFRSVTSSPLVSADGAPLGMVSTHFGMVHRPSEQEIRRLDLYLRLASDFIQRCKLEQVLRQNEAALRDAARRKDEFLALLAHELRNPLAPLRYTLAVNRKTGRTPEQRKRAEEVIERQVTHMSRLLDDLLDVSRITRSTLALEKKPTELTLVVGAAPPEIEAGTDAPVAGAGLKVLVVDDSRDAADTCATLLELSGHHVQTAYTGRRALELAESFRPHALLLDIGLPDFDGYQLATKVRAAPWGRSVILIAVTGWGQEEDRRRAFEAGFDHHLTKPIAAETVESLLQSLATDLHGTLGK